MKNKKASTGMIVFWVIFGMIGLTVIGVAGGYINLGLKTVSADNFQKNYEWFKTQESAMVQLTSQICAGQMQIADFKSTFGNDTSKWNSDATRQYGDLTFANNGYISKYNSLVSDYNARRSNFIRDFGRGDAPKEYAEFYQAQC